MSMLGLLKLVNFGLKKICMNGERTKITMFCVCACVFKKKKNLTGITYLYLCFFLPAYTHMRILFKHYPKDNFEILNSMRKWHSKLLYIQMSL